MQDFQDWLPYVMSLMLIIVLTCSLILRLYCDVTRFWLIGSRNEDHHFFPLILSITSHPAPLRLSRMIRRKEAPDDDNSDCVSLLTSSTMNDQQGGTTWKVSRDSQSVKEVVYTV
ncbi:hypothetical protein ACE3MZ_11070 [Paenibacillus sp. WLX1005]|uniref:hypothetical protein n=1 Tax=unclassified Paenibacillus TaxID=185978 RepID=UPI0039843B17